MAYDDISETVEGLLTIRTNYFSDYPRISVEAAAANMLAPEYILNKAGLDKSYWGKRIIAAAKRDRFTIEDKDLARDWVTCACGKLDKNIPRRIKTKTTRGVFVYGAPKDHVLERLGVHFSRLVTSHRYYEAARTLIAIERRAAQVLKELES